MIDASRFIVRETDREKWLAERSKGVTATAVRDAATESGFHALVQSWSEPPFEGNGYTDFGTWAEPQLLEHAHRVYGILPSDWLVRHEDDPRWLATPDGLSVDHKVIAEAKTTGKDWSKPPIKYVRQAMWQMFVSGAERCLLLWNLRVPDGNGGFYLGWIEPKTVWIDRDESMIADLVKVAERVWEAKNG